MAMSFSTASREVLEQVVREPRFRALTQIPLLAPMEIGGHTDSQGRESMNLRLSQSRADAVLNGLMARNILIGNSAPSRSQQYVHESPPRRK